MHIYKSNYEVVRSYKKYIGDALRIATKNDSDCDAVTLMYCTVVLKDSLFTTGNFDNIDYTPSSQSAQHSFHSTALSLTHHVSDENCGTLRMHVILNDGTPRSSNINPLPDTI